MANKKTYFQQLCLSDDKFPYLISRSKTKENAFRKLCKREIVLSNMSEEALTSHTNEKNTRPK